jgi:tagatose 1,6-diphosphate aldolase
MSTLTIGKIRGLRQITTRGGAVVILALDHRGSLAKMLGVPEGDPAYYYKLRDFKLMILEELAQYASAALIEPQYIAADAVATGAIPGDKGFITALEKSGYLGTATARTQQVLPGWSVAHSKRMGASAVKLYVDYNPEAGALAERQEQFVAGVVAQARAADIALVVEPMLYSLDSGLSKNSAEFAARKPALVVETARRIGALGPDLLKLEFPHDAAFVADPSAWADACAAVDAAAPRPWAVLSAGVDFDTFRRQVQIACEAGASGYVAGRSFWKDVIGLPPDQARAFLRGEAAARMAEVAAIAASCARPWTARYPDLASAAGETWFAEYGKTI